MAATDQYQAPTAPVPPAPRPARIVGLDVARGLAVLGMFGAHILPSREFDWGDSETWWAIVDGRSATLFAVLAGVSIAVLSGGRTPVAGAQLARARLRILTRAVLLFALGGLLAFLGTGIAVILEVYALLFVVTVPFLRWRARSLLGLAGVIAIAGPVLQTMLSTGISVLTAGEHPYDPGSAIVQLTVEGTYPGLVWASFVLVGLAVGRSALDSVRLQVTLVTAGAVLAVIGYGLGSWIAASAGSGMRLAEDDPGRILDLSSLATVEPHSDSPFEVVGNLGIALGIFGLCLLLCRVVSVRYLLSPVAALGTLALTAYTVHIVVIWWEMTAMPERSRSEDTYLYAIVVALVLAWLWSRFVGRGPLERLLSSVSDRAANGLSVSASTSST